MAEKSDRHVPRISGAQSKANIYDPDIWRANSEQGLPSENPPRNSRWKTLLLEMLNETNQAKRALTALALQEAILERHRELTEQRSFSSDSMEERMKMKQAFMRLLDVTSQSSFMDNSAKPIEFRQIVRRAPDWGRGEADDWRELLLRMLGEYDHSRLEGITASLEDAVLARYRQLAGVDTQQANEERRELQLAYDRLTMVRIKVLGYRNGGKAS